MTPRDFCFWLQGWFEIAKSVGLVFKSIDILPMVRKHAELVKVTPGTYDQRILQFIGYVEAACEGNLPSSKIEEKLAQIFIHVIDPNTPGDSKAKAAAHNSTVKDEDEYDGVFSKTSSYSHNHTFRC